MVCKKFISTVFIPMLMCWFLIISSVVADDCVTCWWPDSTEVRQILVDSMHCYSKLSGDSCCFWRLNGTEYFAAGCIYHWGPHCGHKVKEVMTDTTYGTAQLEWPRIVVTNTPMPAGNPPWIIKVWTPSGLIWKVTYHCETCGEFFVLYCKRCMEYKVAK